jgi:pimeloyl-ACP methyl ester carboxylesterase
MAQDAIAFVSAMDFDQVDLLGFSIGSFIAQEMADAGHVCAGRSDQEDRRRGG